MIKYDGYTIEPGKFPDGTMKLDMPEWRSRSIYTEIEWKYENDSEMVLLYYLVNHLRVESAKPINLILPYIPNARMDRVKSENEVFTLKHFCKFINDLEFNTVWVKDAHSNVALGMINRVRQMNISSNIETIIWRHLDEKKDIVFFPDEGSCKRYSDMSKMPYAFGIKKRDWATGKILGLDVMGNVPKEPFNVLIIDDISSYGGTFLHSARKLKELGAQKIYLYITHCENSILKGELINSGLLEKIYTTDSIFTGTHELIEVMR